MFPCVSACNTGANQLANYFPCYAERFDNTSTPTFHQFYYNFFYNSIANLLFNDPDLSSPLMFQLQAEIIYTYIRFLKLFSSIIKYLPSKHSLKYIY